MKNRTQIASAFALVLSLLLLFSFSSFAQEKMTMDEYNAKLAEYQKREADAKAELAKCNADVEALNQQIAEVDQQIASVWKEIYALLGTDEASVKAFRATLNELEGKVDALAALSSEELFKRRAEINELEKQLNQLKTNKIALLSEMQDKIATIEGKIAQLRANLPKADFDEYTVVKGDYLWKIAGKPAIYNDPYQWIRIYTYNRDQIKDPDLIYPNQIFKIQRSAADNEYIVVKGDWLAKIAGKPEIYNDPTKWTKIFEANKDVIKDKNLIYPHQVLILPDK
ncbi:MAG: LysM peptidoglycan-binding domain-containing protein [candidate division KSB1 bacterium]|nr:LysM peptidoglycan-binding domain-containing protein [candidate division KSB1 bacterium]MDZ7335668.1 LysM peptidoglycan-binding domain-containing protein [candidate division KSB1 bacterium]MDZ7357713.1 LysM peptidoglycan-binding domain-containing protein [candidate division KSB1 bacterium]MDZ7375219.1 LysM peptidoglycan-binding domain-containing protein [candidate division KSB1 bacterium]MDZ7402045.1 LysM peptidoglycan-binding domain-containing protein [candidate division KSB1 bacterium]